MPTLKPESRPVLTAEDSLFLIFSSPCLSIPTPPSLMAVLCLDANLESCLSQLYSILPLQFILQGVFSLFHVERMDME